MEFYAAYVTAGCGNPWRLVSSRPVSPLLTGGPLVSAGSPALFSGSLCFAREARPLGMRKSAVRVGKKWAGRGVADNSSRPFSGAAVEGGDCGEDVVVGDRVGEGVGHGLHSVAAWGRGRPFPQPVPPLLKRSPARDSRVSLRSIEPLADHAACIRLFLVQSSK